MFQGKAREGGETSVKVGRSLGESKVGKQAGCLQAAVEQAQAWDSVGQPGVEMARGTAKAESF